MMNECMNKNLTSFSRPGADQEKGTRRENVKRIRPQADNLHFQPESTCQCLDAIQPRCASTVSKLKLRSEEMCKHRLRPTSVMEYWYDFGFGILKL